MKDEKRLNNGYEAEEVLAEELETVTGGSGIGYQTKNKSLYRSGDKPKYKVGDVVEVKYIPTHFASTARWLSFYVTGVSTSKNGGTICKEFTYSLKDTGEGKRILTGVYESCMRRAK